jgi:hypothetical protein
LAVNLATDVVPFTDNDSEEYPLSSVLEVIRISFLDRLTASEVSHNYDTGLGGVGCQNANALFFRKRDISRYSYVTGIPEL